MAGAVRDQMLGQAEGARIMAAAAAATGIDCWTLDTTQACRTGEQRPPDGAPLVLHANPDRTATGLLALRRQIGLERRVIGYWAWELGVVPASWKRALRFVHEVWVPSTFTAKAVKDLLPGDGSIPLRVVPHALAAAPPRPAALDRAAFGLPEDALVVLLSANLASNFARKNPLGAIAAFRQAFGSRRDCLLLVKLGGTLDWPADFSLIQAAAAEDDRIRIETRSLPAADNHALTACADIVLSLHRSEGFGLVLAEAMMLGRPVVATGWSGNMDFMDASCAALVAARLVAPADPRGVFNLPGAVWAEPDLGEAADHLRRLGGSAGLRAALGASGRERVLTCLTAAPLAEAVGGG